MIPARPRMRVEVEHRDVGFLALSGRAPTRAGTAAPTQERTFGYGMRKRVLKAVEALLRAVPREGEACPDAGLWVVVVRPSNPNSDTLR